MGLFHVGDTAAALAGTLTSDKQPVNLTGAALEVHIQRPDGSVITRAATVIDDGAGTWQMPWQVGDLTMPSTWKAEVQVTYSDTTIQTFGPVTFVVDKQIA